MTPHPPATPARSVPASERGGRRAAPITVSLVNDYEVILRGLHAMLAPYQERVSIVEHEVGGTPDRFADVALFDTFAARRDALARAQVMIAERRVDHVVLYTWDASAEFLELAREVGVSGVMLKSSAGEQVVAAIERVVAGERVGLEHATQGARARRTDDLSQREREVLALLALGRPNHEIAHELFLSIDTVKTYVQRIFRKLGVSNRTQAAMLATNYGVGPPIAHPRNGGGD